MINIILFLFVSIHQVRCWQLRTSATGFYSKLYSSNVKRNYDIAARVRLTKDITDTVGTSPEAQLSDSNFKFSKNLGSQLIVNPELVPVSDTIELDEGKLLEEIILENVENQIAVKSDRQTSLRSLQQQLSKSISRRGEVEQVILREISTLREKSTEIRESELTCLSEYSLILSALKKASHAKAAVVKENQELLSQLSDVRQKIKEKIIYDQITVSINQKSELIEIDTRIIDELNYLISEVEETIDSVEETCKVTWFFKECHPFFNYII